ncbi:Dynamitin-domain-containing protein [Phlyctochytrium arcticum]|nr:Dynamitin-domain-containing protein [Phlyctochytrium arcticum]
MLKYRALPDLDTQPDVYETADTVDQSSTATSFPGNLEEAESSHNEDWDDDEDREGVVRSSVSHAAAAERFGASEQPGGFKGGSWRTGSRRTTYESGSRTGSGGDQVREQESTVQRLLRLMAEVEELDLDVQQEKQNQGKSPVGTKGKRSSPSNAQMVEQISKLQANLVGLGQSIGSVYTESLGTDHAAGGAESTPMKQSETGKELISQLRAFRLQSLDDTTPETSQSVPTTDPSNDSTSAGLTYELFYTPESAKLAQLANLSELESRLASLERLIGTHFLQGLDGSHESVSSLLEDNGSLIGVLEKLDNQLALLTQPRQVDLISRRVKSLTSDMERLAELRKKQQLDASFGISNENLLRSSNSSMQDVGVFQTESERRISALYNIMEKVDPVAGVIPHLVSRLRGLKHLHSEAAVFSESLKMLVQEQERMDDGLGLVRESMDQLNQSVKANESAVERNVEALQIRLEDLSQRMNRLSSS